LGAGKSCGCHVCLNSKHATCHSRSHAARFVSR
jgi:hypothetical protein